MAIVLVGSGCPIVRLVRVPRALESSSGDTVTKKQFSTGKRKAVLSGNVPGQAPYALFRRKFKRPRGTAGLIVPALVSYFAIFVGALVAIGALLEIRARPLLSFAVSARLC